MLVIFKEFKPLIKGQIHRSFGLHSYEWYSRHVQLQWYADELVFHGVPTIAMA
jgi:hypothetical protein